MSHALLETWGDRWVWILLHSLWQDGLAALGLWVVLRMLPAGQADRRHAAALIALGLTMIAPVVTWVWLSHATVVGASATERALPRTPLEPPLVTGAVTAAAPTATRAGDGGRDEKHEHAEPVPATVATTPLLDDAPAHELTAAERRQRRGMMFWILAAWGVGVGLQLVRTVRDVSATRSLLCGEPPRDPALLATLARVTARLKLYRQFRVLISSAEIGPFIFGLWKPTLVLPAGLLVGLPADQLEAVLLHELAHLRRYDEFVNFVQLLVEAVFFFNPPLRWISHVLRREREASCDARAVACLSSPVPLAEALARVASGWAPFDPEPATALGLSREAEPGALVDRVRRILNPDYRPPLKLSWVALAGTTLLVAVLVCGFEQATSWSVAFARDMLTPAERIAAVAAIEKTTEPEDYGDLGAKFVLSGTIRADDGAPLAEGGGLSSMSRRSSRNSTSSTAESHRASGDKFKVALKPGQCWLAYSCDGYAPTLVGPFVGKGGETRDNIEIVLNRGVSGAIRVVDQNGSPIAGAKISGAPNWGTFGIGRSLTGSTDAQGLWKDEHLAEVPYGISVHAEGFTPVERTEPMRITADPMVIVLDAANPATGQIVDGAGQPVGGARLFLYAERRGNNTHSHGNSGKALTESCADGTFELNQVAADVEYDFLVDGGDRGHAGLERVRAGMKKLRVVLQKKLTLAGTVRGEFRAPAAKAGNVVHCQSTWTMDRIAKSSTAKLDDMGRFRFDDLFAGRYVLTLGTHTIKQGILDESATDVVIDLAEPEETDRTRDVEIRFVEHGKAVVPEGKVTAQMEIADERGQLQFGRQLPVVAGGVRLRMKTPGQLRLNSEGCQGYWFKDFTAEVPPAAAQFLAEVPVVSAGAIRVRVVGFKSQAGAMPLNASVSFKISEPGVVHHASLNRASVSAGEVILSPVPLNVPCLVSVTQDFRKGYVPVFQLDGAQPVRARLVRLPPAVESVVRVETFDGAPLSGIPLQVSFEPPSALKDVLGDGSLLGGHSWSDNRTTDRQGELVLSGMPADATGYSVSARPTRDWQATTAAIQSDGRATLLRLERGMVLTGRVVDRTTGQPVAGIQVKARPADLGRSGYQEFDAEAPTDANGEFRFSNLPSQTVKLTPWGVTFNSQSKLDAEPGQPQPVLISVN